MEEIIENKDILRTKMINSSIGVREKYDINSVFSHQETGINLTLCCVLDNLLKGAATQVIQNLNSACEIDELTGITYE